jgi:hypothetical protein
VSVIELNRGLAVPVTVEGLRRVLFTAYNVMELNRGLAAPVTIEGLGRVLSTVYDVAVTPR